MRRLRRDYLPLGTIALPPLIAACACVAVLLPRAVSFFTTSGFSDFVWSFRIARELSREGFSVHAVSVSRGESSGAHGVLDIQLGNLLNGSEQAPYVVVGQAFLSAADTFTSSSVSLHSVGWVNVTLFDYDAGSYFFAIDFPTLLLYRRGELDQAAYLRHWSYPPDLPGALPQLTP